MSRRAFITGAGHGIGADIARACHAAGYQVGVFDLDPERAAAIAGSLEGCVALAGDVSDESSVIAALDQFEAATGGPPTLAVNNAGIVRFGPLLEQSVADFRALSMRELASQVSTSASPMEVQTVEPNMTSFIPTWSIRKSSLLEVVKVGCI